MSELSTAIANALGYLKQEGYEIPLDIQLKARQLGAIKASGDISSVRAVYHNEITAALIDYLEGGSIVASRNQFRQAAVEALGSAFDLGYANGGGELPISDDALSWLNARIEQEMSYINTLFEQAKQFRKETDSDLLGFASDRADGYTSAVDELYVVGEMYADSRQMLTWSLGNTEKHCSTCSKLDGERHRAEWFIARNYIPRKPGASMDCGGFNCDCSLTNDAGEEITI